MSFSWSVVLVSQTASYAVAGRRDENELLAIGPWLLGSLGGRGPAPESRSRPTRKVAPRPGTRTMLPTAVLPWQTVQPPNMQQWKTGGNTSSVSCYATISSSSTFRFVICDIYHKTMAYFGWEVSREGHGTLRVWCRIVWYTDTNVAEKRSAFIFSPDYLCNRFSCTIGIYYQTVTALGYMPEACILRGYVIISFLTQRKEQDSYVESAIFHTLPNEAFPTASYLDFVGSG